MPQFKAICPHCFMHYKLDLAYLGKIAQCSGCREKFVLERINETMTFTSDLHGESPFDSGISSLPNELAKHDALKASQEITHIQADATQHPFSAPLAQSDGVSSGSSATAPGYRVAEQPHTESLSHTVGPTRTTSDHSEIWKVGEAILGIYEVQEISPGVPYAQGGVGIVQKIYHREWDMDLAVKSPKPGVFHSESGMASYERECQTWVELGLHPNIVTCYLVRRIGNIPRIFAEFIPDGSLRDWILDCRLYTGGAEASLLRILDIAIQFAWGLDYAHRQGLLHLDVKPANVMMSGTIPKVTDFGLSQVTPGNAREAASGTKTTAPALAGGITAAKWEGMTPGYCSPEQYRAYRLFQKGKTDSSLKITLQSDIWSWAISVLAMFYGRAPCRKGGQTAAKVFELYLTVAIPEDRPRMPESLIALMRHCFQEDPAKRPMSMAYVAQKLCRIYEEVAGSPYLKTCPVATKWTAESINNRAVSLLDLNKVKEAEKLFHEALQMQPWQPIVAYNQALFHWRNSTLTDLDVLERMETLVKIKNDPSAFYALGLTQRERGNISPALLAFESALERESRPEFQKAMVSATRLSENSIRCLERVPVKRLTRPIAYLDEKEETLLIAPDAQHFVIYDTKAAKKRLSFKLSLDGSAEHAVLLIKDGKYQPEERRIALSDDYQWELISADLSERIFLKNAADPTNVRLLTPIPWGLQEQDVIATFSGYFRSELELAAPSANLSRAIFSENVIVRLLELVAEDHEVRVYDQNKSKIIGNLIGHEQQVLSIAYGGRNGQWAITGSKDRTIRIWEFPSCRCVRTLGPMDSSVEAVFLSRSGAFLLAMVGGNSLRIWDVGLICRNFENIRAPILLSRVSSSEELSRQQREMELLKKNLLQAVNGNDYSTALKHLKTMQTLPGWESVRKEIPWDGFIQNCVREKSLEAVCTHSLFGHEDKISSIALSLDAQIAVSAGRDQTIRLWNMKSGKCVRVIEGHQDWIRDIALTWDGRYILSGSWDTSVRIWNSGTGKCVRILNDKVRSISKVAFHPLGTLAAIATASGSVLIWDVVKDKVIGNWSAHTGGINAIAFSRDGRSLYTAGDDASVCIWETYSQRLIEKYERGKVPISAARMLIGTQAIVSGSKDGTLEACWLERGLQKRTFAGHVAEITSMENLVDNRFLFTASRDQTVRIWDLRDGSLKKTLSGHSGSVTGVAIDFSGTKLLTGSEDGTLRFWDLYWDFSYPESVSWNDSARTHLQTLLSIYCPDTEGKLAPRLEEQGIQRIIVEMKYRGFGRIPEATFREEIATLQAQWPGPVTYRSKTR